MATTVLRNSDSKILRNSDGRLLKSNYDFGKGFKTSGSTYLRVPKMVGQAMPENMAFAIWKDRNQAADQRGGALVAYGPEGVLQNSVTLGYDFNLTNISATVYKAGAGVQNRTSVVGNSFSVWNLTGGSLQGYDGVTTGTTWIGTAPAVTNIAEFRIGWGYGRVGVAGYIRATIPFMVFFDRNLSSAEMAHLYNNGLGNEPLSTSGLRFYYTADKAEILDFSLAKDGSDLRVGIKDQSGNGYDAEIMGLPAGTLEQKTAYANTNLILFY